MRPVNKGDRPLDANGKVVVFKKYTQARRDLISRIGEYCSYCERKLVAALAVEHVQQKSDNRDLALTWSNFLLACPNCNSTKGAIKIKLNDYVWPDTDNTYPLFAYSALGLVTVSNKITDAELKQKVENSIKLVGLDKQRVKKDSVAWKEASDRRFEHRIAAWKDANEFAKSYAQLPVKYKAEFLKCIEKIVVHQGFWSIWMRAFESFPEVQLMLMKAFPGTNSSLFAPILKVEDEKRENHHH